MSDLGNNIHINTGCNLLWLKKENVFAIDEIIVTEREFVVT